MSDILSCVLSGVPDAKIRGMASKLVDAGDVERLIISKLEEDKAGDLVISDFIDIIVSLLSGSGFRPSPTGKAIRVAINSSSVGWNVYIEKKGQRDAFIEDLAGESKGEDDFAIENYVVQPFTATYKHLESCLTRLITKHLSAKDLVEARKLLATSKKQKGKEEIKTIEAAIEKFNSVIQQSEVPDQTILEELTAAHQLYGSKFVSGKAVFGDVTNVAGGFRRPTKSRVYRNKKTIKKKKKVKSLKRKSLKRKPLKRKSTKRKSLKRKSTKR